MVAILLAWILVAPLAAWVMGAGIRLAEQRRSGTVVDGAADEAACTEVDEVAKEFAAAV